MQKLKDWFYSLQPRERMLVLGGGGVVLLVAIYFLALAPFYGAVSGSAQRVAKKAISRGCAASAAKCWR
jgi:type II secretory pathway component PulM